MPDIWRRGEGKRAWCGCVEGREEEAGFMMGSCAWEVAVLRSFPASTGVEPEGSMC